MWSIVYKLIYICVYYLSFDHVPRLFTCLSLIVAFLTIYILFRTSVMCIYMNVSAIFQCDINIESSSKRYLLNSSIVDCI